MRRPRRGSRNGRRSGSVLCLLYPRAKRGEYVSKELRKVTERGNYGSGLRRTCSFIRFLLAPVPTFMILLANSTPIVCELSVRHSSLIKRCSRHDPRNISELFLASPTVPDVQYIMVHSLSATAWAEQYDFGEVVVHGTQLLHLRQPLFERVHLIIWS